MKLGLNKQEEWMEARVARQLGPDHAGSCRLWERLVFALSQTSLAGFCAKEGENLISFLQSSLWLGVPAGMTGGPEWTQGAPQIGLDKASGRGGGEKVKSEMYFEGRTNRICEWVGWGGWVVRERSQK